MMMKITTKLVYLMVVTVVIGHLNGMYGTFALNEELFTTIRNFRKHQSSGVNWIDSILKGVLVGAVMHIKWLVGGVLS